MISGPTELLSSHGCCFIASLRYTTPAFLIVLCASPERGLPVLRRATMIAVRWSDFGVFALALVALVGMFLGPTSTTAFLSVTTLSSQPRHTTAATRDGSSTSRRSVAVAGERSRRSALFGIKRKVENMETVVSAYTKQIRTYFCWRKRTQDSEGTINSLAAPSSSRKWRTRPVTAVASSSNSFALYMIRSMRSRNRLDTT